VDGEDGNITSEVCLSIWKKGSCKNMHSNYDEICLTYLLTPWTTVLLEKPTVSQLVKKFPAFYGTRKFITAIMCPPPGPILSQIDPAQTPTSHFLRSILILSYI
jgi:hypothetical protein